MSKALIFGILVLVALAVIGTSWWIKRSYLRTMDDFLVAGRRLGPALTGAAMLAAWCNALTLSVNGEYAFELTFPDYMVVLFGALTLPILLAIPLGAKVRDVFPKGYSTPGFLRARYGKYMHILTLLAQVVLHMLLLVVQLVVGGAVLATVLHVPTVPVQIILIIIAIANIAIGGMWSSVATDYLQICAAIVAVVILLPLSVAHAGGAATMYHDILGRYPDYMNWTFSGGYVKFFISSFLSITTGALVPQYVWQRFYAARDKSAVRRSFSVLALAYMGIAFAGAIPTLIVMAHGTKMAAADDGLLTFLTIMPGWASALLAIILLTFVLSVTDSTLNAIVPMVADDLLSYLPKSASMSAGARGWTGRAAALVLGGVGIVIALGNPNTVNIFFTIGLITLALTGPIVLGLLTRRLRDWHAAIGTVCGLAVGTYYIHDSFNSLMTGLLVPIGVSLALSLIKPGSFDWRVLKDQDLAGAWAEESLADVTRTKEATLPGQDERS